MSEQKTSHTPGPWSVRPLKHDDWGMVRGADSYPVALCATQGRGIDEFRAATKYGTPEYDEGPPEVAANAQLIAAAPELLAACRKAKRYMDSLNARRFFGECDGESILLSDDYGLTAAINKALGKD